MAIKKLIKKIGKFFIVLKEEENAAVKQSILIVDNGYSSFEHVFSGIKKAKSCFPQAELSVITLDYRRASIEKEFCDIEFIISHRQLYLNKYQIALHMLKMRERRFDFVLLFSLDLSTLIASLFLANPRVILYNQWGQWWSIRLRNINELFKITYHSRIKGPGLKSLLKRIGLFFILLQQSDIGSLKRSVLLIDNGYAPYGQLQCAILRINKTFAQARITALTSREELKNEFPELELIEPEDFIFEKYRIANAMLGLDNCYDYIILLSLDITPILASFFFVHSRVFLYNNWHQWWSIKPRPVKGYLMAVPKLILSTVMNVIIFVYLLISVSGMFLKKSFNVFKSSLSGKRY